MKFLLLKKSSLFNPCGKLISTDKPNEPLFPLARTHFCVYQLSVPGHRICTRDFLIMQLFFSLKCRVGARPLVLGITSWSVSWNFNSQ